MLTRREVMHEAAIGALKTVRAWRLLEQSLGGECSCPLCATTRELGARLKLDRELLVAMRQQNGSDVPN